MILKSNKDLNLIRVEESIVGIKDGAYSTDTSIRINGWESLRGKGFKVGLLKGIKSVEQKLPQYVEKKDIVTLIDFESVIGNSPAIQHVLFKVEQVADTDTTVLVLGETGTGKELAARAIHNRSLRNKHPLVKVNCAALPEKLCCISDINDKFFAKAF